MKTIHPQFKISTLLTKKVSDQWVWSAAIFHKTCPIEGGVQLAIAELKSIGQFQTKDEAIQNRNKLLADLGFILSLSDVAEIFIQNGLHLGRLITASKTAYYERYPYNTYVFNANVFTETWGKVWYGDLDITLSSDKLIDISTELGEPLYVLCEMDGRFENENLPFEKVKELAVAKIEPYEKDESANA